MPTVAERFNFEKVESDGQNFILDTVKLCKVNCVQELTPEIVNKIGNKGDLNVKFLQAMQLIERQHNMIINQRVHMSQHQSRMIELQDQVISLQERLLTANEGLFKARKVSEDFKTEIVNTFQKEVCSVKQSFSDVVKSGSLKTSAATISTESIKSVAKQIALEEELGRNIMVFGLCEEQNEDICTKVSDVLESLGERPRVEACRIGKKSPSATRPVKVSLSSSSIVQQILKNSSKLSGTEKFKRVFLAPDRTAEERAHRKELVLELKRRAEVEKDKKLFIRGGKICSLERQK